jgi:hypothetical protein
MKTEDSSVPLASTSPARTRRRHHRHRPHRQRKSGHIRRLLPQLFSTLIAPLFVGLVLQSLRGCDPFLTPRTRPPVVWQDDQEKIAPRVSGAPAVEKHTVSAFVRRGE